MAKSKKQAPVVTVPETLTPMYASMTRAKGDPTGIQRYYQIHAGPDPLAGRAYWRGPYRDRTDAENAAHAEAAQRGLDLTWLD